MRFLRDLAQRSRNAAPADELQGEPPSDPGAEPEPLASSYRTIAQVSRELADWIPILRRLVEAETLRDLALGQCSELTAASVRSIITARRLRDGYFWPLMNDAAWSLMLELFAKGLEGERLDVNALSVATDIPIDTTLHWVDWLTGRGMVLRNGQAQDPESALVSLTDAGSDEMRAYLLASLRLSPWVQ
jgi:hypothetical protein